MDIIKVFTNLFNNSKNNEELTPEGFCPACWGRQEYGGKFYEATYKEDVNLNNIASKRGWISAYVSQNLEQIKLVEVNGVKECSSCTLAYKNV